MELPFCGGMETVKLKNVHEDKPRAIKCEARCGGSGRWKGLSRGDGAYGAAELAATPPLTATNRGAAAAAAA